MGAKLCDVYAIYAEPLESTRERIAGFRAQAAAFGRTPGFNVSLRPIIAEREGDAWDKANRILAQMTGKKGWSRQEGAAGPVDNAGKRLMSFADQDIHDERLWMPIARVTGALGNTSCLVGTPEQVADAILKYYVLGVDSFLIRGFDPFNDTIEFGRELIPRIKAGADRDRPASRGRIAHSQRNSLEMPMNSMRRALAIFATGTMRIALGRVARRRAKLAAENHPHHHPVSAGRHHRSDRAARPASARAQAEDIDPDREPRRRVGRDRHGGRRRLGA